jgi:hypothetical protein
MGWYKLSGQELQQQVERKIKMLLGSHSFFLKLLDDYKIPHEDLQNHLRIIFTDLQGKFAEGNGEEIKLDNKLLEEGFFHDNFHFVVHEFFHWIKRRSEALFYFNDDEEVQSFALAMAWEIMDGKQEQQIAQTFLPIISGHFKSKIDAKRMFQQILHEAKQILAHV